MDKGERRAIKAHKCMNNSQPDRSFHLLLSDPWDNHFKTAIRGQSFVDSHLGTVIFRESFGDSHLGTAI